jgi:predicted ATPase/DNA-binding CsgD family transcriptional regulator
MVGRGKPDPNLVKPLTPREQEILLLIGNELSNRQIAEQLTIAMSTVKWYVRQIYNKLGVDNRADAIDHARSLGLVPEERESVIRHNLPVMTTPFVGREQELSALAQLIADPQVSIITIIGPGGIGKTRLALEAARRQRNSNSPFPDGIFFVPLAPVSEVEHIIPALAEAIDFPLEGFAGARRFRERQLLDHLRGKRLLIVLDNFEHMLEKADLVSEIVSVAPGVQLLVTSRERLRLQGEQLFAIEGLEIPERWLSDDANIMNYAAVQLFLNTAKRLSLDFVLTEGDGEQLVEICRLAEGMPLGLELAASWVTALPLAEIATRMKRSLAFLASDIHDVPARHRSMQAALDTSWQSLAQQQQEALQKISVFRGGFTRSASFEVTGATLPLLITLVGKSWLSYDRAEDRYQVHELLRQYAEEKLSVSQDGYIEARNRHSVYFCSYLGQLEADLIGARQVAAVSELQSEIGNCLVAWKWAAIQGDVSSVGQGLDTLCHFFNWEGRAADGESICREAAESLSLVAAESAAVPPELLRLQAKLLAWETEFTAEVEEHEDLIAKSQALLDQARSVGEDIRAEQAFLYLQHAHSAILNDLELANRKLNQALREFKALNDLWGEAETLARLGMTSMFLGKLEQARQLALESLAVRRQLGNKLGIAQSLSSLAVIAKNQGYLVEAVSSHQESLLLYREMGHAYGELDATGSFAYTLCWAGEFDAAKEMASQAVQLSLKLAQYDYSFPLGALAKAEMHLGAYEKARTNALTGLEAARSQGSQPNVGWHLLWLGGVALVGGDPGLAEALLLESAEVLAALKHNQYALPLAFLVYVSRARGKGSLAYNYLDQVLKESVELQLYFPLVICLPGAALLAADRGNLEEAAQLYSLARSFDYVANSIWFADVAGRELDNMLGKIGRQSDSAMGSKELMSELWATADRLLDGS